MHYFLVFANLIKQIKKQILQHMTMVWLCCLLHTVYLNVNAVENVTGWFRIQKMTLSIKWLYIGNISFRFIAESIRIQCFPVWWTSVSVSLRILWLRAFPASHWARTQYFHAVVIDGVLSVHWFILRSPTVYSPFITELSSHPLQAVFM